MTAPDTSTPTTTSDAAPTIAVPEGFRVIDAGGPFIEVNGPFYLRQVGSDWQLGFRVEARHLNPIGGLHGGMMASFCDMVLPILAHRIEPAVKGRFLPTISLQIDYLAPAKLGDWVQGEAHVLRATRSIVFIQGLVTANGAPVARTSGVFKIGPEIGGNAS